METSDNEDGYEAIDEPASPATGERADVEESGPDQHLERRELDEPSTESFRRGPRAGVPGTIIVMSPADLQLVEEESRRRRSRPSALRSSRAQLAAGADKADGVLDRANEKSTAEGADENSESKAADEEIAHKPADGGAAADDEVLGKIRRRKSMYLTDDMLKKESVERYKIEIPLRKKVNKSTKKKLWREIERRKPFITENVREHIRTYAKPPFITWGCRNCVFPHESEA